MINIHIFCAHKLWLALQLSDCEMCLRCLCAVSQLIDLFLYIYIKSQRISFLAILSCELSLTSWNLWNCCGCGSCCCCCCRCRCSCCRNCLQTPPSSPSSPSSQFLTHVTALVFLYFIFMEKCEKSANTAEVVGMGGDSEIPRFGCSEVWDCAFAEDSQTEKAAPSARGFVNINTYMSSGNE